MNKKGFTLPEVMVALGIFSIGMIASFGLQMSSLATSRKTEQIKIMTELATSELEVQRQFYREDVEEASDGHTCTSTNPNYTCAVAVQPCIFTGTAINCSSTTTSSAVAHYITVTVSGPRDASYTVSTLVRKKAS